MPFFGRGVLGYPGQFFIKIFDIFMKRFWTLPQLVDRKISMDYKQEGETDGEKEHRTAKLLERV
jgi:hypothetical protein